MNTENETKKNELNEKLNTLEEKINDKERIRSIGADLSLMTIMKSVLVAIRELNDHKPIDPNTTKLLKRSENFIDNEIPAMNVLFNLLSNREVKK